MSDIVAFLFAMAACWLALAGCVRLQKWIAYERTRKQQDRQYLAWMKQQQQRIQSGAVQQAAAERREAREDTWRSRVQ